MKRLVLVSCSSKKKTESGALLAIDRYQGGMYKVIGKAKREGYWPRNTQIFIVSAKYGLISEGALIGFYDQKMTRAHALELQVEVSDALDALLREEHYDQIFLNLGEIYMLSIAASIEIECARQSGTLHEASGGIGTRQKQTKEWLIAQSRGDLIFEV